MRSFASTGVGEVLISSIISSILANATVKPSKICARDRALRISNTVRRVTTSRRCAIKHSKICLRFKTFGWPPTSATMLIPNTVCNWVWRYKLFSSTSAFSPRRTSITTRMPSLSDSSRKPSPAMPSISFSLCSSAIFSISRALLT